MCAPVLIPERGKFTFIFNYQWFYKLLITERTCPVVCIEKEYSKFLNPKTLFTRTVLDFDGNEAGK